MYFLFWKIVRAHVDKYSRSEYKNCYSFVFLLRNTIMNSNCGNGGFYPAEKWPKSISGKQNKCVGAVDSEVGYFILILKLIFSYGSFINYLRSFGGRLYEIALIITRIFHSKYFYFYFCHISARKHWNSGKKRSTFFPLMKVC